MSPHEPSNPASVGSEKCDKTEAQGKNLKIVLENMVGSQLFHKLNQKKHYPIHSRVYSYSATYVTQRLKTKRELQSNFFYQHS